MHRQFAVYSSKLEHVDNLAKLKKSSDKSIILPKEYPGNIVATGASTNKFVQEAEKGFKLLDDLVEVTSQAEGTTKDSDITEVDAMKSIFGDVIDEIISTVEKSFNKSNLDTRISDAFVLQSKTTKQFIAQAPSQTAISAIIKPYVAYLKEFSAKAFKSAT